VRIRIDYPKAGAHVTWKNGDEQAFCPWPMFEMIDTFDHRALEAIA
jgi:hypothetical protein